MHSPSHCILKHHLKVPANEQQKKHVFMLLSVDFILSQVLPHMTFFLCPEEYLSSLQGLPGPPGEKGENGDVGAMVSVALSVTSLCCFHVQPREVRKSC